MSFSARFHFTDRTLGSAVNRLNLFVPYQQRCSAPCLAGAASRSGVPAGLMWVCDNQQPYDAQNVSSAAWACRSGATDCPLSPRRMRSGRIRWCSTSAECGDARRQELPTSAASRHRGRPHPFAGAEQKFKEQTGGEVVPGHPCRRKAPSGWSESSWASDAAGYRRDKNAGVRQTKAVEDRSGLLDSRRSTRAGLVPARRKHAQPEDGDADRR